MKPTPIPCDTLLTADTIVSQNDTRDVLRQAALAVTDGRIAAMGPADAMRAQFAPRQVIDLPRAMVLPGLVNTHTHAAMTLLRGLCDDAPLSEWLTKHIWPVESRLTDETVRLGTALACAEMLASGTTCFFDAYLCAGAVAEAAGASGLRAIIGQGVMEIDNPVFKKPEAALQAAEALATRLAGHDRLRVGIFAHAVYSCSTETLSRCVAFARDQGMALATHAVETPRENEDCQKTHGRRVIPYLRDLHFLGPGTLLAHGVALDADDIGILAATGTGVAHCPKSNMKLASGIAPVAALREAGVKVALGTDGAASNNALNLFSEMHVAALLQKVATGDPTALNAQAVLDMATRDGADALGWPGLGRLAVGGPADLCALDLDRPNLTPSLNPVSNAVYAASGGEVVLTMVAGRVLYRDGAFPGFDYPALLADFRQAAARLTHRTA